MNKIIAIISIILLSGSTLLADIAIIGKKEMVQQSDLVAIVDIQELISTDKTQNYVDLIATGQIIKALKGNAKGEIKFRILRFFPCAAFDVSTGRHLVFLKKNEKKEYVGVNWYMSYLYLGSKTTKWFDDKNMIVNNCSQEDVIKDTEMLIKESSGNALKGIMRAKKDIAAGKMKILYYGKPWSHGKPLIDDESGLPVEIVAGCCVRPEFVEETGAYNKTMRQEMKNKNKQIKNLESRTINSRTIKKKYNVISLFYVKVVRDKFELKF